MDEFVKKSNKLKKLPVRKFQIYSFPKEVEKYFVFKFVKKVQKKNFHSQKITHKNVQVFQKCNCTKICLNFYFMNYLLIN